MFGGVPVDFSPNGITECPCPGQHCKSLPSPLNHPYLGEAGTHHCSAVDHGAFLPHEEPWDQGEGRPSVSTEPALAQEASAM